MNESSPVDFCWKLDLIMSERPRIPKSERTLTQNDVNLHDEVPQNGRDGGPLVHPNTVDNEHDCDCDVLRVHEPFLVVAPEKHKQDCVLNQDNDGFSVGCEWEVVVDSEEGHVDEDQGFRVSGEESHALP